MSYALCDDVRMNNTITILLGAVLPIMMVVWQIVKCGMIIRKMRAGKKPRRTHSRHLLSITLYS